MGTKMNDPQTMTHVNRLINESSPYLLQHAHNPVAWFPWGEEALLKAQVEDRPIFLSIGYSACHWCHVMEHESFRDETIARILNENFVSIKVDREERPDLDDLYMNAVQIMTGRGGWPLNVFLTPRLKPFFGGTYFPPTSRGGIIGFDRLLRQIIGIYRDKRCEVEQGAMSVVNALRSMETPDPNRKSETDSITVEMRDRARESLLSASDPIYGGIGDAPKFPQPLSLLFLLSEHRRTGDPKPLNTVLLALESMARGGIHDHIGGGFHRYAVDRQWRVPHFEKMLYDNALLAELYLRAYRLTHSPLFERTAIDTLDFLLRDMQDEDGGFYASLNADSGEGEGTFYTWTPGEVLEALGPDTAGLICRTCGISAKGDMEDGRSVFRLEDDDAALARKAGLKEAELRAHINTACRKLRGVRSAREAPSPDQKIITHWNALTIRALCIGTALTGRSCYADAGRRAAQRILSARDESGAVPHHVIGRRTGPRAFLDDHAAFAGSLLDLHAVTGDTAWLLHAVSLADDMIRRFRDDEGRFVYRDVTRPAARGEALPAEPSIWLDSAVPSALANAAETLARVSAIREDGHFDDIGEALRKRIASALTAHPSASFFALHLADCFDAGLTRVLITGPTDPRHESTEALAIEARRLWLPETIVLSIPADTDRETLEAVFGADHAARFTSAPTGAFVCKGQQCAVPVTDAQQLRELMRDKLNETTDTE